MKGNSFTILLIFSTLQTLFLAYYFLYGNGNTQVKNEQVACISSSSADSSSSVKSESQLESTNVFKDIITSIGIDKLFHRYQNIYGMYLGPIRHKKLNFLEIGLGCTMKYGAGKSLIAWKKYLTHPETQISFVEYDRECAEKFKPPKVSKLFIGDQSDFVFLEKVGKEGGPYDFIVDDGGHKRTFQVNSFLGLWPYIKSGGIYVMEDLFFSFYKNFDNSNESSIDMVHKLIMLMNDANHKGSHMLPVNATFSRAMIEASKSILSINCFYHGCVFVKTS